MHPAEFYHRGQQDMAHLQNRMNQGNFEGERIL